MKKKNRLQMLAALLAATLSMALTSPIAAKANEEYNVDTTKETNATAGRIYYLKNSHGDVIGQMDENGTVLTSYAYNAFGEQVSAVTTKGEQISTTNRFLYAGEQYDETSGFYYLRARHYDVKAGRFTQEDTYLGDGRNLYAYVHSNPLKYVDPTGHNAEEIFDGDDSLLDDLEDKSIDGAKVSQSSQTSTTAGFDDWLNTGATDNKVYFGMKDGTAQYTGITKQTIDARLSQHNSTGKGFDVLEIQHEGLTRNQARAIEQYYIENGPSALNKINSISSSNIYYQAAMNWAEGYLGVR